jgi:hypothetical protein
MSSDNKSTEEEYQISLNTTGLPFSKLKYNQDKLGMRCEKLDIPCVVLPEKYQEYRIRNYGYANLYRLQFSYWDYHLSRYDTQLPILRSLFSQPTLFWVSFLDIEWVNFNQRISQSKKRRSNYSGTQSTIVQRQYINFKFYLNTLREVSQETN